MTEKKRLPEQMASHTYRKPARAVGIELPASRRDSYREERRKVQSEASYTSQRVVTVPEADPSTAWNAFSQRQRQRRQQRARPQTYVKAAPRTFAQTGAWASSGRIKAVRAQSAHLSSPVPTRSGHQARRRSFFWRLLSAIIGCALLVLALNFALTSNAFRIEQVSVVGTHNDALMRRIQRMGLQGQNIFLINISAMTQQLEALPLVESASLNRQFPNQLVVTVVERTPVLLWHTTQGTFSVDNQGVVIAPVTDASSTNHMQTVVDLSNQSQGQLPRGTKSLRPGTHLQPAEIAFAVSLLHQLPGVVGLSSFQLYYDGTIYASDKNETGAVGSRGSFIVESPDGWKAYLGNATDANPLDNRLLELQQILALAQKQQLNLATIDLRYGLHPVYTLK